MNYLLLFACIAVATIIERLLLLIMGSTLIPYMDAQASLRQNFSRYSRMQAPWYEPVLQVEFTLGTVAEEEIRDSCSVGRLLRTSAFCKPWILLQIQLH